MKKLYTEEQKTKFNNDIGLVNPYPAYLPTQGVAKSTLYKWIREAPPKKAKPVNMTDFRILKQRKTRFMLSKRKRSPQSLKKFSTEAIKCSAHERSMQF